MLRGGFGHRAVHQAARSGDAGALGRTATLFDRRAGRMERGLDRRLFSFISISVAMLSRSPPRPPTSLSKSIRLASRLAQSFAIPIVVFAGDSRTSLRQPPVSHRIFQNTTLGISCPYTVGEKGEATKRATAAAAGTRQPGASRRAPVEHLYREVVCVPRIFGHIRKSLNLPKRLCSCRLSARHVPVTPSSVSQRRLRLDPNSASL